jgi:non-specific serine/threonine protein kinase
METVVMHAGDPANSPAIPAIVDSSATDGRTSSSTLPVTMTSFVGRSAELDQLQALLLDGCVRILTLTGPGGVGKTRLALKVARDVEAAGAAEVAFVSLVAVSDPGLVAPAIGRAFGLSDVDRESLAIRLVFELASRPQLLVLDNFEHVIDAAPLISALAASCESLTLLSTSRVPLRVSGEREFPVPPLAVPGSQGITGHLEETGAVALFLDRAGMDSRHTSNDRLEAIATICRRLDGLPLAIELAAAKTRVLPPEDLASRLDRALPLLTDGPRDAPERHRTMRAAIAWSYDLLSDKDKALFRTLSVFNGGFTLESASEVSGLDANAVIEGVTHLSDQGLVRQMSDTSNPVRFTMLETIREFGLDELVAAGNERDVRDRHAAWFTELFDTLDVKELIEANHRLFRLRGEEDNARAGLRWSLSRGNATNAATLALGLAAYWWEEGAFAEARESFAQVLAMGEPLPASTHAALLGLAAEYTFQQGAFNESGTLAHQALEIARGLKDTARIRWHLRQVSWVSMVFDPPSAIAPVEEIIKLCESQGAWQGMARSLYMLAMVRAYTDELSLAYVHVDEAQAILDSLDSVDIGLQAVSHQMQGSLALFSGKHAEAEPHLLRGLELRREQGNRVYEMHCLRDLGRVALELGDRSRAASRYGAALEIAYLLGSEHGKSYCFVEAASVSSDPAAAATLLGAADTLRRRLKLSSMPSERALRERTSEQVRELLGKTRFQSTFASGGSKSTIELYELAKLALSTADSRPGESNALLTPREREVLCLISEGKSDREIAVALFVSRRTAATHVRNLFAKLDVHSRAEAAAWAVRNGIV